MSRGGKRAGAGRRPGSISQRTKENRAIADRAVAEGLTPLEVHLGNMRHYYNLALDAEQALAQLTPEKMEGLDREEALKVLLAEVKKTVGFRDLADKSAERAAPYLHPKLSAIQHTGKDGEPLIPVTDADRARALAAFVAKTKAGKA